MFCKNCGNQLDDNIKVCSQCGTALETSAQPIQNEYATSNQNTNGYPSQTPPMYTQPNIIVNVDNSNSNVANANVNGFGMVSQKSKTVALILAIISLFGFGGLHRFYVGKVGTGIIHLLTIGICWIGTIIDIISILSGNFKDGAGLSLKN